MRPDRFAPLPTDAAAALYEGLAGEDDWRLILPYVPDERRGGALAILGLMTELEAMPARVSEPMMGRIRCQWWRDAVAEAFGAGRVRAHPLAQAIEATLGDAPRMAEPLGALIDGAEDVLDAGSPPDDEAAFALAEGVWGRAAAALCVWLGTLGDAEAASTAAACHALVRLSARDAPAMATRSLPRASDLLGGRPLGGEVAERGLEAARGVSDDALPALLTASLIAAYAKGRTPSALGKRARYFKAVLTGRP